MSQYLIREVAYDGDQDPAEVVERAARLYRQGQSLVRIGDQLGFDHETIHRALLAANVPMRDTHRERPRQ